MRADMDAVVSDFAEELRPDVPQIAQALPRPVTSAEVLEVEIGEHESVATIRHAGETDAVTVRSRWQDVAGRPLIVHAEPIG